MDMVDDKTREMERLTMTLRDAEERERERQQVLVTRLRASVSLCSTNCSFDAALFERVAYTGD